MEMGGYDRAVTVFSPDGRLVQVEYARESVKRGTTIIGIEAQDGVALLADKRLASRLLKPGSVEKIFRIDKHVGATTSGLVADARALINMARILCQKHTATYTTQIGVETLAKIIGDHKQSFTQYGGLRPFGVSMLMAGYDGENRLFETDPSGAVLEYRATAVGSGKGIANEILEKDYREDITLEDAILLGLKILHKITEGKISAKSIDIGVVESATGEFRNLGENELELYLEKVGKEEE